MQDSVLFSVCFFVFLCICQQWSIGAHVYRSDDGGGTWRRLSVAKGMYWANLFQHDGSVYLLGTSAAKNGSVAISRSADGGLTWHRQVRMAVGAGDGPRTRMRMHGKLDSPGLIMHATDPSASEQSTTHA